jgi:hypothetical protein
VPAAALATQTPPAPTASAEGRVGKINGRRSRQRVRSEAQELLLVGRNPDCAGGKHDVLDATAERDSPLFLRDRIDTQQPALGIADVAVSLARCEGGRRCLERDSKGEFRAHDVADVDACNERLDRSGDPELLTRTGKIAARAECVSSLDDSDGLTEVFAVPGDAGRGRAGHPNSSAVSREPIRIALVDADTERVQQGARLRIDDADRETRAVQDPHPPCPAAQIRAARWTPSPT